MDEPESLRNICLEYLSANYEIIKIDSYLPQELCEALIFHHTSAGRIIDAKFANVFSDTSKTKVKKVYLRSGEITAEALQSLLEHNLTHLDVSWCARPPSTLLQEIIKYGPTFLELCIGSWKRIEHYPGGFWNCVNLRKLEVQKWHDFHNKITLSQLITPLRQIISLNLSGALGLKDLSCLSTLPNLRRLYLHKVVKSNFEDMPPHIACIRKLTRLTHLDISSVDETYKIPDFVLGSIVHDLPDLVFLDISGTNLAGRGVIESQVTDLVEHCDIVGLMSRGNRPLNFLGLYDTKHNACRRQFIPAKIITGDADETQLLNSVIAYIDRPHVLEKVLNDIYTMSRDTDGKQSNELYEAVVEAMERHMRKKMVQISGSASLFFLVKNRENRLSLKIRRRIIRTLLDGMLLHKSDQFMLRNGCLCLCQFKIPQDVMFEYRRLVEILLYTTIEMFDAVFVQRIAIYLLNSLACQVDGVHKHILGEAGTVPKMLQLISKRLRTHLCDDVMEVAWSTLWNVTDETALNCQYFLENDGMKYFVKCLEEFPGKPELLRNMMGLLGNVAEVRELRPRLMKDSYVHVFTRLLRSGSDGIEVSYNACGVLAHMCSDGVKMWTVSLSRKNVLDCMREVMSHWNLYAERNINYRSFEPILGLLLVKHTPECQLWAAWALANLTTVYPSKYCALVEEEGGIPLLQEIAEYHEASVRYRRISDLCNIVLTNCNRFKYRDYADVPLEG